MPGRRGRNLRSGDLAEELGILLLKGIAAVAEVPRPEDVGFDGVATLLREDGSGFLYAEDSFYVQLKSASVGEVVYEGHEAEWLMGLKLPLFIGSVDSKTATISLYTTFRLSQMAQEAVYQKLALHMTAVDEQSKSGKERVFNIGPPLLVWSLTDLQLPEFRRKAFDMLKTVIDIEMRNLKHRTIKHMESIQWVTNDSVTSSGFMTMGDKLSSTETRILEAMSPYVDALTMRYMETDGKDERDLHAMTELIYFFERRGLHVNFSLMLRNLLQGRIDAQTQSSPADPPS